MNVLVLVDVLTCWTAVESLERARVLRWLAGLMGNVGAVAVVAKMAGKGTSVEVLENQNPFPPECDDGR